MVVNPFDLACYHLRRSQDSVGCDFMFVPTVDLGLFRVKSDLGFACFERCASFLRTLNEFLSGPNLVCLYRNKWTPNSHCPFYFPPLNALNISVSLFSVSLHVFRCC